MYDFAEGEVTINEALVTCGCDSCYRQKKVDSPEDVSDAGRISGQVIGILSDGRMLLTGCCPEHQEGATISSGEE